MANVGSGSGRISKGGFMSERFRDTEHWRSKLVGPPLVGTLAVVACLAAGTAPAHAEHLCTTNPPPVDNCEDAPPPDVEALCSNGFTIDFISRVVNAGPPVTTTFTYVIDGPDVCRQVLDISHFSLAWELCVEPGESDLQFFGSSPNGELKTGLKGDPSTGYCSNDVDADFVKFNVPVRCAGGPVEFSVTFWGEVALGEAEVMFKAGPRAYLADVPGPGCGAEPCDLLTTDFNQRTECCAELLIDPSGSEEQCGDNLSCAEACIVN
jgi:hypothetical protein